MEKIEDIYERLRKEYVIIAARSKDLYKRTKNPAYRRIEEDAMRHASEITNLAAKGESLSNVT